MKTYLFVAVFLGLVLPSIAQQANQQWFLSFTTSPALMYRSTIGVEPSLQSHKELWDETEKVKVAIGGGAELGRQLGNWDLLVGLRFADRGYQQTFDSLISPDEVTATGFIPSGEPKIAYKQSYSSYMLDMPMTIRRRIGTGILVGYVGAAVVPSWSVDNVRRYRAVEPTQTISSGFDEIAMGTPHQFNVGGEVQGGVLLALSDQLKLRAGLALGSQLLRWVAEDQFNRRLSEARLDIGVEYRFR